MYVVKLGTCVLIQHSLNWPILGGFWVLTLPNMVQFAKHLARGNTITNKNIQIFLFWRIWVFYGKWTDRKFAFSVQLWPHPTPPPPPPISPWRLLKLKKNNHLHRKASATGLSKYVKSKALYRKISLLFGF